MTMIETIKKVYHQHIDIETKTLGVFILIMAIAAMMTLSYNHWVTQYIVTQWVPTSWYIMAPMIIAMLGLSQAAKKTAPKLSLFTWTYTLYFIINLTWGSMVTGVQTTPFTPIDPTLLHLDHLLGFSSIAVMHWAHVHQWAYNTFQLAYDSLYLQMFLVPLLVAFLAGRREVNVLFLSMVMTMIIGGLIYYFWPTMAPSSVVHSPYFTANQHATATKFWELHHHIPINVPIYTSGIIAFPSFHVIWSTQFAWSMRKRWWLSAPITLLNLVIIASTVFLGWHYLTDVIAGVGLAAGCFWMAYRISAWQQRQRTTHKEPQANKTRHAAPWITALRSS